ncbi:MAG: hypothetical protein ACI9V8_001808, partial [Urechidicola sp.]
MIDLKYFRSFIPKTVRISKAGLVFSGSMLENRG